LIRRFWSSRQTRLHSQYPNASLQKQRATAGFDISGYRRMDRATHLSERCHHLQHILK